MKVLKGTRAGDRFPISFDAELRSTEPTGSSASLTKAPSKCADENYAEMCAAPQGEIDQKANAVPPTARAQPDAGPCPIKRSEILGRSLAL